MSRSSRAPGGGRDRLRTRCTRRSLEVTVPSDSHQPAAAGKHHVGDLGGGGEQDVLHHQAVEPLEQARGCALVGFGLRIGFSPMT